ncbi:polyhydroxyalkanoate depolymerase [Methylibium sp.]|uniref:polyhydroxyalkanoate depolymerase n=1 Tax=Methylibium sp. TaxID=2067992 RepID=UPI00180A0C79|nr:polyhydroxyalkanoate depolymerase [Methylibium sp.]MBA3590242.1 polyhydroxyalkanoate depolymerase [Methylibium sp.]
MLYQLYETQRALLSPFAEFAGASSRLYSHPMSPFAQAPGAQRLSAGFDLMHRLTKEYEKPEFGITDIKVGGTEIVVQQQTAVEKPFCRLLRFKRYTDDGALLLEMRDQPSVLVVAPLSGHHSTLLRDTVKLLLQHHKVYITDWIDARMVPAEAGAFRLADYVHYMQEFIRHVGPTVNVISVCQPTVPVLAAVSLMASNGENTPRTMVMMGGPIDARKSPTAVNNLAMNKPYDWFERNVIYRVPPNYPGAGRRVYPGFMQHSGFVAMNPQRHMTAHYDYFLDLLRGDGESTDAHRSFYDEYNAVLDMPAEYYLDTIKTVFQDFALVNGTWEIDGELVRPQDIKTTALLTVEGELDDISGSGQTAAALELCAGIPKSRKRHYEVAGAGHYGIFSGRRWREFAYPEIREFILKHQKPWQEGTVAPAEQAAAKPVAAKPVAKPAAKSIAKPVTKTATKTATKIPAKRRLTVAR